MIGGAVFVLFFLIYCIRRTRQRRIKAPDETGENEKSSGDIRIEGSGRMFGGLTNIRRWKRHQQSSTSTESALWAGVRSNGASSVMFTSPTYCVFTRKGQ